MNAQEILCKFCMAVTGSTGCTVLNLGKTCKAVEEAQKDLASQVVKILDDELFI